MTLEVLALIYLIPLSVIICPFITCYIRYYNYYKESEGVLFTGSMLSFLFVNNLSVIIFKSVCKYIKDGYNMIKFNNF